MSSYEEEILAHMKKELKVIEEEYKNDPQKLKLLSVGYKEMIKKLEK